MRPVVRQASDRKTRQIALLWKAGSSGAGARMPLALALVKGRRCFTDMVSCNWNSDDRRVLEQQRR